LRGRQGSRQGSPRRYIFVEGHLRRGPISRFRRSAVIGVTRAGRAAGPRRAKPGWSSAEHANAEAMMSVTMRNTLSLIRGVAFLSAVCIGVPVVLLGYLGAVLTGTGFPAV
jgi:hypothetical protein